MLNNDEVRLFAERCVAICDEVSDETGFVPIKSLVQKFGAELLFRPLLVEGMLAITPQRKNGASLDSWTILIDSERHGAPHSELESETEMTPLSSRLRNTIAHELVHSLAYRHREFDIRLDQKRLSGQASRALVDDIEKETERLSPLLLLSEKALDRFSFGQDVLSAEVLSNERRRLGISRHVLVNRLRLLRLVDGKRLLGRFMLRDVAVGLGEWEKSGHAIIKKWPLFSNFDGGLAPDFVERMHREDRLKADALFDDPTFVLAGGNSFMANISASAGNKKIAIQCSVESHKKDTGAEFLFVVARTDSPTRAAAVTQAIKDGLLPRKEHQLPLI